MKILNIFKKANLKNTVTKKSNAQTLDKNQLEKVIGGAEYNTAEAQLKAAPRN